MADYSLKQDNMGATGRIDWVDYAKGFCIVFVVMMHSTLGVEKHAALKAVVAEGTTGWMHYLVTFAQPFRMPDFFLISGLFLGLVIARPIRRYVDRKVIHFIYFFVLWTIIQLAFRSIFWIGNGMSTDELIRTYLTAFVEPYGTLWFIYMLPVMFMVTRWVERIDWKIVLGIAMVLEILPIHTGWIMIDEFAERYVYFFAGYALAQPIFQLAGWARKNVPLALAYLGVWAILNGMYTLMDLPGYIANIYTAMGREVPVNLAQLPVFSLALGIAGAIAVVCLCAVLSQFRIAGVLKYLGKNSIVVYLAFFLPMVINRELLLRFAPTLDLGTMSLIVTVFSVTCSMIAWEFTQKTGLFRFLFIRPHWASIDNNLTNKQAKASLQPAE